MDRVAKGHPERKAVRLPVACAALLVLLVLPGCRHSELEKRVVRGKVTYASQPVTNGDVLFYPLDDTRGPVAGASIKDGAYVAEAKDGVPVGRHRVQIRAFRVDARNMPATPEELDAPGQRQQYLPEKYNTNTTLEITVPSGSGPLRYDFDLPP